MVSHCGLYLTDGNAQRCQQAQTQRTGHGPSTRVPAQRSHLCKCGIRSRCLPALPERAAQNLSRGDGDRQRDKTDVLGMRTASDEHRGGLPPPPGSAAQGGCSPAREPANTAWDNTAPPDRARRHQAHGRRWGAAASCSSSPWDEAPAQPAALGPRPSPHVSPDTPEKLLPSP